VSFVEEEYLRRVSYKLRNFKNKGHHKYSFSCCLCGDSLKSKSKARGSAYDVGGTLLVSCFNCGYSSNFNNWLKEVDPLLHKEFIVESFKSKITGTKKELEVEDYFAVAATKKYKPNIFAPLDEIKYLPADNIAKKYADSRMLPFDTREMYYVEKFVDWTHGHTDKFKSWTDSDHPRIVFPFKARDGHYIGYTARSLQGEEPKYYRIFIDDEEKERFYGIDRLDESKQVFVLEGEVDSMFLPNAIAVSNGKLDTYFNKDAIYLPDMDSRNGHIVKGIGKLVDRGLKVCLLPDGVEKDINAMVMNGFGIDNLVKLIYDNTYQGLEAKLKFSTWRKV
jgi:hypothetical protein